MGQVGFSFSQNHSIEVAGSLFTNFIVHASNTWIQTRYLYHKSLQLNFHVDLRELKKSMWGGNIPKHFCTPWNYCSVIFWRHFWDIPCLFHIEMCPCFVSFRQQCPQVVKKQWQAAGRLTPCYLDLSTQYHRGKTYPHKTKESRTSGLAAHTVPKRKELSTQYQREKNYPHSTKESTTIGLAATHYQEKRPIHKVPKRYYLTTQYQRGQTYQNSTKENRINAASHTLPREKTQVPREKKWPHNTLAEYPQNCKLKFIADLVQNGV